MKIYRWVLRGKRWETCTLAPAEHELGGAVAVRSRDVTPLVKHEIRICA